MFQGEGRNFSAGFDFGDWESHSEGDLLLRFVRIEMLLQRVAATPCLTVALAHGRNFGAGVDLFGACKWRLATPDASFRMPGLKFGLVLGTRRFAALVGAERARTILEQAATFDAESALRDGFVSRLAARDEWPAAADEALAVASALTDASRAQLYAALSLEAPDADLARLTRSAAEPGLKARVAAYLQAASRAAGKETRWVRDTTRRTSSARWRNWPPWCRMAPASRWAAASCIAGRSASCVN